MKVQLVNGSGSTATRNGLGNLVVGYDENVDPTTYPLGSHNIGVERLNGQ